MTARRLLTVVHTMLAETRSPEELDEMLHPPSREDDARRAREARRRVAARFA